MNETKKYTVTKPFLPPKEDFIKYVDKIYDNAWLTNQGPFHQSFEKEISEYLDIDNITLYTNGHLALENVLLTLNFPKGSEVITTPFTFVSTVHAISLAGHMPVFCDIKDSDLTIDEEKIEDLITEKTVAIMPVHVYGHPCNMEKIQEIANKYNLRVIYDAAHAFGVKVNGKSVASYGDFSMFSFHATKLFNSIEGGALAYNDGVWKHDLDYTKNFGIKNEEEVPMIGRNCKMNEFQAAMGLCNLKYMDDIIEKRKQISLKYRECLNDIEEIKYFVMPQNVEYNFSYFPVIVNSKDENKNRDTLYGWLQNRGIGTRKYFYPLISNMECYADMDHVELPVAEAAAQNVLTLPLYYTLTFEDVEFICQNIKEFFEQ